jgi:outer membrane protein assembly factor BamB
MRAVMRRALTGVVALGLLAVCAQAASANGWARTDLRPVTQPAPAGGLFVLAVAHGGGLSVVGLDARTGATVWSRSASTSDVTPGVAPNLVVAGGKVVYLAPDGSAAALVAADAQTGTPLWTTGPGTFTGMPALCYDDASAVCLTGTLVSDAVAGALRFDVASGRRLPAPHVTGPEPRELGNGLYDIGARDPEKLTATRGPKVAWSRPLARVFPLRGATSDYGWVFDRIDRLDLFVGSVGNTPRSHHSRITFDRARTMTVGFRIADGVVRWRTPGDFMCGQLPCAGEPQAGYSAPEQARASMTVGLRGVERGTVTYSRSNPGAPGIVSRDARVTVEGFAPASGRTLWRFDAGRNTGLINLTLTPPQVGLNAVLLTGTGGKLVSLNLASGARSSVSSTAHGWCRKLLTYRQTVGYKTDVGTFHTYIGQDALVSCGARSRHRLAPPPTVPAWLGGIGARNAGLIAWSDTAGVIAEPEG